MSSEAGGPAQRNGNKEADCRPAHPGRPFPLHLGGRLRGRKSIPILTQTEGNKSPLIPSRPSRPAWQQPRAHSLQLAACSRAPTQASLPPGSTDPSWEGWRWGAKAPQQRSPPGQDQRTHISRPSQEVGAVPAKEGTTSIPGKKSQVGPPSPVLLWPRPYARPMDHEERINGRVKCSWRRPQSCKMPQEHQPPCTLYPYPTSSSSCPQREPWLGRQTDRQMEQIPAQWSRGLASEPPYASVHWR